ncbi:hypothetical protein ZWY2020_042323 [Hordeum vulgare]|nr:hypothetical protein ZWY2020_042323 [Hordeum vulgare]
MPWSSPPPPQESFEKLGHGSMERIQTPACVTGLLYISFPPSPATTLAAPTPSHRTYISPLLLPPLPTHHSPAPFASSRRRRLPQVFSLQIS